MSQFDRYAALIDRHLAETGQMPTPGGVASPLGGEGLGVREPKILPWPAVIPMPISTNRIWRSVRGRVVKSEEYRQWIKVAVNALSPYRRPLKYPVQIEVIVRDKLRANRDIDNAIKSCLDAMVTSGVLHSDDCRHVRKVSIEYQPGGTGVEVWIREGF